MSAVAARLSDSAFIADLTSRERSFWRFVATILAGIVAGFIIGLAVGAVAVILMGAAIGVFGGGFGTIQHRVTEMMSANGASMTGAVVL